MISNSSGFIWEKQVSENQNLHFKTLQIMAEGKKLEFNERKLRTLGIKNKYGQFTNLGLLLSDENPIVIKFAVYGKDLNFLVKEEFSGSIVNISERLLKYAETFNATSAVIEPGRIDRIETKSFPGSSLREGILNCICHADYSMPSNIKVEFFPAFVKLSNPGGFYKASLRDILDGTQTFRNPGLVNVLAKLNFIENYGTGILRIQEAYRDEELKPEFYASEGYFKLSLPNLNYQGERKAPAYAEQKESYAKQTGGCAEQKEPYAKQTGGYAEQKESYAEQTSGYAEQKNSSQRLNPFQIESFDNEILCFIKNSNGLKKKEIIAKLKSKNKEASVSKVENSLKRLIKKGIIVFEGESTKKGVYVVALKKE